MVAHPPSGATPFEVLRDAVPADAKETVIGGLSRRDDGGFLEPQDGQRGVVQHRVPFRVDRMRGERPDARDSRQQLDRAEASGGKIWKLPDRLDQVNWNRGRAFSAFLTRRSSMRSFQRWNGYPSNIPPYVEDIRISESSIERPEERTMCASAMAPNLPVQQGPSTVASSPKPATSIATSITRSATEPNYVTLKPHGAGNCVIADKGRGVDTSVRCRSVTAWAGFAAGSIAYAVIRGHRVGCG